MSNDDIETNESGAGFAQENGEQLAATATTQTVPIEQSPLSQPNAPKRIANAQTVCNERNAKNKPCHGFLKQLRTGGEDAKTHLRGQDVLYKCQTCGTLYTGAPLGHLRDPEKQSRYVEKELAAILRAAGGTLPAYERPDKSASSETHATPHRAPSIGGAPVSETQTEKNALFLAAHAARPQPSASRKAKLIGRTDPTAHSTSGQNSSPEADTHRASAEAQAATGYASAAPLSPSAATASPAASDEKTPVEEREHDRKK
ncbi:MAG: hypothetical protein ABR577_04110 [Pyrinomonadaceae bacterium]